jgi:hypothetical protein
MITQGAIGLPVMPRGCAIWRGRRTIAGCSAGFSSALIDAAEKL